MHGTLGVEDEIFSSFEMHGNGDKDIFSSGKPINKTVADFLLHKFFCSVFILSHHYMKNSHHNRKNYQTHATQKYKFSLVLAKLELIVNVSELFAQNSFKLSIHTINRRLLFTLPNIF